MKPIEFKEQNCIYAKDQPEYLPLPVYKIGGTITCCWKLSFKERIKLLFNGILYVTIMNFNNPLQPHRIVIDKKDSPIP